MGFFGKLKRKAFNIIGQGIEKIGEITHIFSVEMFGLDMQINNPVKEKVDVTDSNTSVEETINVHTACERARKEVAEQAEPIEEKLIEELKKDVNKFRDYFAEILPEDILRNFDYSLKDISIEEIHNTTSEYVSKKISQDNDEYVKILNMDDSIRKEESKIYIDKVLKEAKEKLESVCQSKKKNLYTKMYNDLEEYFTNQRKIGEEQQKNYEELKKHKDDIIYQEELAISTIIDIAYMECIRTLTFTNR